MQQPLAVPFISLMRRMAHCWNRWRCVLTPFAVMFCYPSFYLFPPQVDLSISSVKFSLLHICLTLPKFQTIQLLRQCIYSAYDQRASWCRTPTMPPSLPSSGVQSPTSWATPAQLSWLPAALTRGSGFGGPPCCSVASPDRASGRGNKESYFFCCVN